jgi:hypothetical protein
MCEYVAKDEDGDGHAAANCVSTNGVPIQEGDDCNDQDPNLYPGHPEACTTTEDGGTPAEILCVSGSLTCQPSGPESACTGTVACVNAACVAIAPNCVGVCTPGTTQCSENDGVHDLLSEWHVGRLRLVWNERDLRRVGRLGAMRGHVCRREHEVWGHQRRVDLHGERHMGRCSPLREWNVLGGP